MIGERGKTRRNENEIRTETNHKGSQTGWGKKADRSSYARLNQVQGNQGKSVVS